MIALPAIRDLPTTLRTNSRFTASLAAGYIFDRYSFEGTSFASSGFDRVNIGAGPFTSLSLNMHY